MENSTGEISKPTVNNGYNLIWIYFIWICFFFTTALPNFIVALSIVRYRALNQRKEYLIMAGLSFSDFIYISCFSVAGPLSGIMLVVVSVDRLFSVCAPLKYFSITKTYAHRMLIAVYSYALSMCLLIVGLAFTQKHESAQLVAPCFTGATALAVDKYYAAYYLYVMSISGLVSVVLYVGVVVMYWKKKQQLISPTTTINHSKIALDRKRQRKLTENLAISCLCTCIFYVIPIGVAMTAEIVYELPRWVMQFIWLLPPVNPFCNAIIFYKRQPHLKKAIRGLFTNKLMPGNFDLWNVD